LAKQLGANLQLPPNTRILKCYSELESYLVHFACGVYPFIWLTGRPGVGKTETAQAGVRNRKAMFIKSGHVTPLGLYRACYEHLNEPIILDMDEVESLVRNADGRRLLLALGESKREKQVQWLTTSTLLGQTPTRYETTSPLCIIANETTSIAAIQSRALMLFFDPTNEEVHRYAASWFWDQTVHDWFGRHHTRLRPLDVRWYVGAYHDRLAGRDWAHLALKHYALNPAECHVQDLENDPAYPTRNDKERRFRELMAGTKGASRSNYHLILSRLCKSGRLNSDQTVASFPVRGRRPRRPDGQEDTMPPAADLPIREAFVRPITGEQPGQTRPANVRADDTLGWERPQTDEEDE
jgi:hypothetical protein